MLNEALERHREGDLEAAERLYCTLLDQDDSQAAVHHFYGLLLRDKGDPSQALIQVERAIALDDNNPEFFLSLAGLLHAQGDIGGASANAAKAIEIDPNVPEGHNTLGYLQFMQGDLVAAEQTLRVARKVAPDSPGVLTNLGNVMLADGRVEDARTRFEQALSLRPDDLAAQTGLGRAFLAMGAASFAQATFERCHEQGPDSLTIRTLLADAQLANEQPAAAEANYQAVVRAQPGHVGALVGLGDTAMAAGRAAQAAQRYTRALAQRRGQIPVIIKLGDALLASGDAAAATLCFERLVEQGENSPAVRTHLGRALAASGHPQRAATQLEEVLAEQPANADAALALAGIRGSEDDHAGAIALLLKLPEAARERTRIRVALARHQILAGHPSAALAALGTVAEGNDLRLEALELTGRAQDEMGDYAAAADTFATLAAEADTPPPDLRFADVEATAAAGWPREPIDDQRGEPVFLLGLPGSGISAVAEALATLEVVDVIRDRGQPDTVRQDFLSQPLSSAALAGVDEHALRMGRRRYWNGVRHARTKLAAGIAGVDLLPPTQCDPVLIARFFPRATLLVVTRDPADHLLHADSFGWRDDSAPTELDLEAFYGRLAQVAAVTDLNIVNLDFDALRSGETRAIEAVFGPLGVSIGGFEAALAARLAGVSGLHRFWAAGHSAHYAASAAHDPQALDALRDSMSRLN